MADEKKTGDEEFGPAMMALDERARKFVVLRVYHKKNPTQAAKGAGYSSKTDGYLRVQGHRLMRSARVIAALREEAERRMGGATAMALVGLAEAVETGKGRNKTAAQIEVLDRFGFGKKTVQDIRVEHVDTRSTAELLAAVRQMLPGPEVVAGTFKEVADADAES